MIKANVSQSRPAQAQAPAPRVAVEGAWARPAARGDTSAVYFTLISQEGQPLALLRAETQVAEKVEIHETVMESVPGPGGMAAHQVMKMRPVAQVTVPAGGRVAFQPGGLHVMLIGLRQELREGQKFPLVLVFKDRASVTVEVRVGAPAGPVHGH